MVLICDSRTTILPNFVLVYLQLIQIRCKLNVNVFIATAYKQIHSQCSLETRCISVQRNCPIHSLFLKIQESQQNFLTDETIDMNNCDVKRLLLFTAYICCYIFYIFLCNTKVNSLQSDQAFIRVVVFHLFGGNSQRMKFTEPWHVGRGPGHNQLYQV